MSKRSNSNNESTAHKMVPLREEFAVLAKELAGGVNKMAFTLVLGQMEYWQGKKERAEFVVEEIGRVDRGCGPGQGATAFGWIYKSARDLASDLFGLMSERTVARALTRLHELGSRCADGTLPAATTAPTNIVST